MRLDRIAILGAGSWGSALSNAIARAGRGVTLWARDPAHAATLTHDRESPYLPGIRSRLWRFIAAKPGPVAETGEPVEDEPSRPAAAPVLALIERLPLDLED